MFVLQFFTHSEVFVCYRIPMFEQNKIFTGRLIDCIFIVRSFLGTFWPREAETFPRIE